MSAPMKHCPGYGSQGPHELPATPEHFSRNAPAKDGLYSMCRKDAYAYQGDWNRRRKAIAKAQAMEPGSAQLQALSAAQAMPPIPKRKPVIDTAKRDTIAVLAVAAAATPDAERELVTQVARDAGYSEEVAAQLGAVLPALVTPKGWTTEQVGDTSYPVPTDPDQVGTPKGQLALDTVNRAILAERRRKDAERKRAERAAKKQAQPSA